MIRESNQGYYKNDFTMFDKIIHDDAVFTINREDFTKDEVRAGFAAHHQIYIKILKQLLNLLKPPFMMKILTTKYGVKTFGNFGKVLQKELNIK